MKTIRVVVIAIAVLAPPTLRAASPTEGAAAGSPARTGASPSLGLQPADQGIATSDLVTTRDINQAIAETAGLSSSAREIRVTTYKARVILRGVVASSAEKHQVEEIALHHCSVANLQNELDIVHGAPGAP